MRNEDAPHILNTSANLLGICFLILSSIQVLHVSEKTIIDGVLAFAIFLFMSSCLLSFLSMRKRSVSGRKFELLADYIFLGGLFSLFITTMLLTFNIVK
jgi:hypothetical protein